MVLEDGVLTNKTIPSVLDSRYMEGRIAERSVSFTFNLNVDVYAGSGEMTFGGINELLLFEPWMTALTPTGEWIQNI